MHLISAHTRYVCLYLTANGHLRMAIETDEVEGRLGAAAVAAEGGVAAGGGDLELRQRRGKAVRECDLAGNQHEDVDGELSGAGTAPRIE